MSADISPCGTYRYSLTRDILKRGFRVSVIMVNPSTADAVDDDATIRKIKGFGSRLGWHTVTVANLFAYRATDVKELAQAVDPIGPLNDGAILSAIISTDLTVVAWGASGKLPTRLRERWRTVVRIAASVDRKLYCFGKCADGHPLHPVMIAYANILREWDEPK